MKPLLIISGLLLITSAAFADYEIRWYTIDGGGGTGTGGSYLLTGTIGQPDAAYAQNGAFVIMGGFWPAGSVCIVNLEHFAKFAEYWLTVGNDLPADLYDDGGNIVNLDDLEVFLNYWLSTCPPDWPLK